QNFTIMRFILLLTTISIVFTLQFNNVSARSYSKPSRSSSFKPVSQGALLYRTQQLDPELMRRSSPEDVLNQYVKQNQEREALLNQLTAGGSIDIIHLTSGSRSR
ncbi:hypothetical protein PENTCL1PPCAC_5856, partial [Pristionchus entomophagus]